MSCLFGVELSVWELAEWQTGWCWAAEQRGKVKAGECFGQIPSAEFHLNSLFGEWKVLADRHEHDVWDSKIQCAVSTVNCTGELNSFFYLRRQIVDKRRCPTHNRKVTTEGTAVCTHWNQWGCESKHLTFAASKRRICCHSYRNSMCLSFRYIVRC